MTQVRCHRWLVALTAVLSFAPSPTKAQDAALGVTVPFALEEFVPGQRDCSAPTNLGRSLTFFQDNRREFMEGVGQGLAKAAADRGLSYRAVVAEDNAAAMNAKIDAAVDDGLGAAVVAPVDARTVAPFLRALIQNGTYVGTVVPPPAVTILNAPQYLTGKTLADAAARYIDEHLGGRANVVLLTHDSLQFLAPRFTAMRDVMRTMPGVSIVADISPITVNEDGGYETMQTILIAQPRIDVVLGADTVVLGALRALRETGKARPDQFFGGIDGEPDAVKELLTPDSPYKASVSLASPVFGYALGQFAADWLEGKWVPQAMDILPTLLTAENINRYSADVADPAGVWRDAPKRKAYLRMYGGICFDTRGEFLDFPWSSEAR